MAFASWYSIHHILPDAEVVIFLPKKTNPTAQHFRWVTRVNQHRTTKKPFLVIPSHVMAVRELNIKFPKGISEDGAIWFVNDDNTQETVPGLCAPCTSTQLTAFVQVNECGKYNKKTWPEKAKSSPFPYVKSLKTAEMSVNEHAVLNLWDRMQHSYAAMA